MRAHIVAFHSPDIWDLEHDLPRDPANTGALVQIMARPDSDVRGRESFDVVVGTSSWFDEHGGPTADCLVVEQWHWPTIEALLRAKVAEAEGPDWHSVATQLDRWALWEFRDYRPYVEDG